ncbi:hypothetical protein HY251_15055 [bacterium]|nr:hypothetical protein [bacterium]
MDDRQRAFTEGLTKEERLLVAIRDELYEGSWDELVSDLEARRNRKPFVFKLASRLEEDLARIGKLRAFEKEHAVDLGALLGAPGRDEEVGRGP